MSLLPSASNNAEKASQTSTPPPPLQEFEFGLASPVARLEQLSLSEYLSDVVFKVGSTGELIHAHKVILTLASEVFYRQFNGGLSETNQDNRQNPIVLKHIEPDIFKLVLHYIYSQKIDLTPENIIDIYCVSDMYFLTGLKLVCENFFETALNVKNVLKVFESNRRYGFENVDKCCFDIIQDNPIACFQSDDFQALSQCALELIAACRIMNCEKGQLCTAINQWCTANGLEADIIPQLESMQCEKLSCFSTFRYEVDISSHLKVKIKGKMHLYGLGIIIGPKPMSNLPPDVKVTVTVNPGDVTVCRTIPIKKNLYVEKIMFEKITFTDECRILVTFPEMSLLCLQEFKPVDTLGALELAVTDVNVVANQYHGQKPTNCVAYLLYSLDSNAPC